MKSISLKLFAFLLGAMVVMGCSKSSDSPPSSQDVARTNLSKTWRLDVNTIRVNNLPLSGLAALFPTPIPDLSPVRIAFVNTGTYTVAGAASTAVAFLGFNPSGTWAFDGTRADRIILNPGAIAMDITSLTTSSMNISYSTVISSLPATVTATLLPAN